MTYHLTVYSIAIVCLCHYIWTKIMGVIYPHVCVYICHVMPCYTILSYYTVLYYTVLYYTVLYEFSHDEVMIDFYVRDSCHTNISECCGVFPCCACKHVDTDFMVAFWF